MTDNNIRWGGLTLASLSSSEQIPFLKEVLANPGVSRLLTGCAGSGKTLLAAFALDQLRDDKKIDAGFLVYTKLLEKFVKDNFDAKSSEYPVDHFHFWEKHPKKRTLYIIDESQDFQSKWIDLVQNYSTSQIWIGDEQQQIYDESKKDNGFNNLVNTFKTSERHVLSTNYRNTLSIAKFASRFLTVSNAEADKGITLKDKINEFILPIIKATNPKPDDPVRLIKADNLSQEYDAIAQVIRDIQSNPSIKSKQIAVAHMIHDNTKTPGKYKATLDDIGDELSKRGIVFIRIPREKDLKDLPNFTNKNIVILTPIHSLKGLEVDFVIFPQSEYATNYSIGTRDNLLFVLFTRARFQLICSYVDEASNYILQRFSKEKNLDFIQKVHATDILNSSNKPTTGTDVLGSIKI